MKRIIQSFLLLALGNLVCPAGTASANDGDPFAFRIVQDNDMQLSCEELVDEAVLMRDIIQTTQNLKSESELNGHAVTAAGAIGSFLIGSVTGGIGLAAAGFVASQDIEADGNEAEYVQDIASQRRALMVGIHKAKGCDTSMAEALKPIVTKSSLQLGSEKLADMEPASGSANAAVIAAPRYNE